MIKGKTYEEIYGPEKAAHLRKLRAEVMREMRRKQGKLPVVELLSRMGYEKGGRSHIKDRLIEERMLKNECAICGRRPEWCGKSLTLQLDHTNGDRTNWSVDNLRLLCPNCHSQTPTFGGRNMARN